MECGEWRAKQYGGASPDRGLLGIDFERAPIADVQGSFDAARFADCYPHLGQSVYMYVHRLGIQKKYDGCDFFRLRVKKLSAIAFLSEADVADGFELSRREFLGEEVALM